MTLSGGQQQQLAMSHRRSLLDLTGADFDEPTERLIQPSIIKRYRTVIRRLADQGGDMAIILVEQFYDFAEELADNYTVMAQGQSHCQGMGGDMPEKASELVAI